MIKNPTTTEDPIMNNQLLLVIADAVARQVSFFAACDCPRSRRDEEKARAETFNVWLLIRAELEARGLFAEFRATGRYLL